MVKLGAAFSRRDLKVPYVSEFEGVFFQKQREDVASAYLYWMPGEEISLTTEVRHHDFDQGASFTWMRLTELPIALKYVTPAGLWLGATATFVDQQGVFTGPGGIDAPGSDSFWTLDAAIEFRLAQRKGTITLEGTNLLGEDFRFQELDLDVAPRYVPEAQLQLRFSVGF